MLPLMTPWFYLMPSPWHPTRNDMHVVWYVVLFDIDPT
jgi:hypothetical protein